jgi:hypothetical protein
MAPALVAIHPRAACATAARVAVEKDLIDLDDWAGFLNAK